MNVQYKKGVLELCVMVLLNNRDHYGYELVQSISENIEISEGTVYPLLRRLTKEGYFSTYLVESQEGPPRKYYSLTDTGREYMGTMVNDWKEFTDAVNLIIEKGEKVMTKDQYLEQLALVLKGLPAEERMEILADYEEHFQMAYEDGKQDDEIIEALGSPKSLAKELAAGYFIDQAQNKTSLSYIVRAVIAVLSLGFFNLVVVLGPFLGLLGFLSGLYIMDLALLFGPIVVLYGLLQTDINLLGYFQAIFIAIATISAGVLAGVGLIYLTKFLYRLMLHYLRFNLQIIQGKGERA